MACFDVGQQKASNKFAIDKTGKKVFHILIAMSIKDPPHQRVN
jgi:hypothetical protein